MKLLVVRDLISPAFSLGTLSVVEVPLLTLQTLELGWNPEPGCPCGRPDRSCTPAGVYTLELHDSPAHPHTFALVNPDLGVFHYAAPVPAPWPVVRTACLIHAANYPDQLEGCTAVGLGRQPSPPAVWQSQAALSKLMSLVPWTNGHTLEISYAPGVTL